MSNIFSNKHFVNRFSPTKTGGPALISGKTPGATPPKPSVPPGFSEKGKTDTGQARPGKSLLGVLGSMVKGAGNAVLQSFKDDANTVVKVAKSMGNAFDRNARSGQGGPSKVSKEKKPFYVGKKPILTDAQKKKQAENAKNKG